MQCRLSTQLREGRPWPPFFVCALGGIVRGQEGGAAQLITPSHAQCSTNSRPEPFFAVTSATSPTTIEKFMTLSAGEFAKSLAAFAGTDVVIADGRAQMPVGTEGGTAEIVFVPLPPRRVGGLLELPQAKVAITLRNVPAGDAEAFLRRFDIAFQRGGG